MAEITDSTYAFNVLKKWLPRRTGCWNDDAYIIKEGTMCYQDLADFIDEEVETAVVARGGT